MKKKLLYITILTVIVLLQFLVVKQYIADRWFKKGYSELHEYDANEKKSENIESKPLISDSSFRNAITWDGNNPEIHYQLAKLYETQMHQAAQEEGKWEIFDNKSVFNEGEMSKHLEQLAINEYYRAISLNPCVNYYHLDLAWLLKSKLRVGGRRTEVRGRKSEGGSQRAEGGKRDNVSNIIKEFRRATALAPNRTYNHKIFADWLVEHILYLENDNETGDQYKKNIGGFFDEAVREYKKAISLRPSLFNEALKSLTMISCDYNKLKKILPPDNSGMKKLVFFLLKKGCWDKNEKKFIQDMESQIAQYDFTIKPSETIYPFYNTLASLYKKKGDSDKAIDTLQDYLKIDPAHAGTHFTLANLSLSSGKPESSKRHFKRAIELDPKSTSYLRKYVSILSSWKEPTEAEAELKSLIEAHPEDVFINESLGGLYLHQKRFEEAESVYRKIIFETPDKARGYFLLGKMYEGEGKQEKAIVAYRKFAFYTPDKAKGYFLIGKMYERQKNRKKARENYKKATLLNRKYRSHFNRMIPPDMLFEEYFKATQDYNKLKVLIPLSPDSLNKLVLFLYKKNAWDRNKSRFIADLNRTKTNFEKSKENINKEKRIRPWLLAYYKTLADVYVEKGNYRKAVSVLNEAIEIDPDNPEGHLLLAEYSFDVGNVHGYTWEFSKNHYEMAIALSSENYKYERAYAISLAGVKKFEEAENHMKKAIEKRPNDPELHEALGMIYEKAGKIDLAIDELSQAVSLSRGAEKYKKKLAQLLALK